MREQLTFKYKLGNLLTVQPCFIHIDSDACGANRTNARTYDMNKSRHFVDIRHISIPFRTTLRSDATRQVVAAEAINIDKQPAEH